MQEVTIEGVNDTQPNTEAHNGGTGGVDDTQPNTEAHNGGTGGVDDTQPNIEAHNGGTGGVNDTQSNTATQNNSAVVVNNTQPNTLQRVETKKTISLDFNCDLAQSFGVYKNDSEFELLDYVSSVNIATGFHAGDPIAIKNALIKASEKNVVIGAHIGFNDIQGFGTREVRLTEEETEALVVYQVGALMSFAKAYGLEVEHVRPHGAMYKLAAENFTFSCAIARAVKKCSKWLTYVGATGDVIEKVGDYVKIPIAKEIKLNKVYNADLTIDYRSEEIKDIDLQIRRLQGVVKSFQIGNNAGGFSPVEADTIHFSVGSLELIKRAHEIISPKPVNYAKVESSGWV